MTLVIDASALLAWLMPDEIGLDLKQLIESHDDAIAPWLLWAEARNILMVFERRGRLPQDGAENMLAIFESLSCRLDTTPDSQTVLALCRDYRLTAYDALYLELALRRRATLATGDAKLALAARAVGVTVA